ncbi:MAG: alpha/beta hydrolase [Jatrophihabitans sp.]|uniref:alpha/beta hydrolase n=1 Tax=Jatrophihabitans sp. TaxID=1932789 RepID=UPI003F80DE99
MAATEEEELDPALAAWGRHADSDTPPATVEEARAQARAHNARALAQLSPRMNPADETDQVIPADGDEPELPIRVLRPPTEPGGSLADRGPLPTVVYFHGGGWVLGDLDTHLGHARRICTQVHAVVVSVGYRLAPEHRFPTAFHDAVRATDWVADRLDEFGGTPTLVVAGDSAGGQLAASVAIARRDAGAPLAAQLLLYPVTDVAGRYEDEDVNARYMSRTSVYQRFGLTLDAMAAFARQYVDPADAADWRVSPMRAADLAGVAPAVVHTSTLDVLRTEGNFYADALRAAGVDVIAREFPSLNHSYFGLGGVSTIADAAAAQAAEDLRTILAGVGATA